MPTSVMTTMVQDIPSVSAHSTTTSAASFGWGKPSLVSLLACCSPAYRPSHMMFASYILISRQLILPPQIQPNPGSRHIHPRVQETFKATLSILTFLVTHNNALL